jgi:prepilin signal peptidase PulO-like enzyme (type II secretory pathway)
MKAGLPYIGLPIIMALMLVLRVGQLDAFILLRYELIIFFGYIAAVIDAKTKQIPNLLVVLMLASWVIISVPMLLFGLTSPIPLLIDSGLGFVISGVLFLLIYLLSRKGLGGGDVKFMSAAGLYLGVSGSLTAIFLGSLFASLVGLVLILLKKIGRKDTIPLAPFLYVGILAVSLSL